MNWQRVRTELRESKRQIRAIRKTSGREVGLGQVRILLGLFLILIFMGRCESGMVFAQQEEVKAQRSSDRISCGIACSVLCLLANGIGISDCDQFLQRHPYQVSMSLEALKEVLQSEGLNAAVVKISRSQYASIDKPAIALLENRDFNPSDPGHFVCVVPRKEKWLVFDPALPEPVSVLAAQEYEKQYWTGLWIVPDGSQAYERVAQTARLRRLILFGSLVMLLAGLLVLLRGKYWLGRRTIIPLMLFAAVVAGCNQSPTRKSLEQNSVAIRSDGDQLVKVVAIPESVKGKRPEFPRVTMRGRNIGPAPLTLSSFDAGALCCSSVLLQALRPETVAPGSEFELDFSVKPNSAATSTISQRLTIKSNGLEQTVDFSIVVEMNEAGYEVKISPSAGVHRVRQGDLFELDLDVVLSGPVGFEFSPSDLIFDPLPQSTNFSIVKVETRSSMRELDIQVVRCRAVADTSGMPIGQVAWPWGVSFRGIKASGGHALMIVPEWFINSSSDPIKIVYARERFYPSKLILQNAGEREFQVLGARLLSDSSATNLAIPFNVDGKALEPGPAPETRLETQEFSGTLVVDVEHEAGKENLTFPILVKIVADNG